MGAAVPAATAAAAPSPKSSGSAPTSIPGVERPTTATTPNTSGAPIAPKATTSQTASAPAEKPVSAERMKRAEEAKQNALSDGASPQEADEIAAKMLKYGTVISAGQGRGSVYAPYKPTEDSVKPIPAAPPTGGQLQQATAGVASAQSDATAGGGGATNIVAPSNSTVVNNNQSAPSSKDTRNNESTFQRYLDRRYYPTAAR